MSTTWRENYSFPRIFKGRRERTGPAKLRTNRFQGDRLSRRKENSSQGPADVSAFSYVAVENPHPGAGMGRSTRAHAQGFVTDPHACLLAGASFLPRRRADSDFHGHRRAV
ncbi:hypothetical protein P168DRAFT_311098 [Aspergillus campestris IBT 28561]|uniref:Uncharacterized protein n=1 Tax=Aspergillus campestris (strain IBT 28561) TaxID=1392248 RepID=A0A2I1D3X4_ASPC2|nr:hypothetical protein P168DRAFT_311098 [Aspergillus campestris IBT 28561]